MSFPRIEGYVVTEKLGSGSYSTVYKAYTKVGARSVVAVKCIDKSRIKHSGAAVDNLVTEIRLLKTLTHPHIVHMKEFTWDDRNIYIIMEYCCGGDLSKYIQRYGRVPEKQVLYFLQQLASALKFLREKGVVHMDLKPHNLLLHKGSDGKYTLKVADFGFAQHMSEESMRSVRGSPLYMAPEMIAGEYDARVDLWSVGVIMYECLFGKAPYSSATFKQLVDKIQRKDPIRIPPNSSVSPGCLDLLTRLLQHDPDKRISYEEFFSHEYLDLEHMPNKENYDKKFVSHLDYLSQTTDGCLCTDALLQHDPDKRISYEEFFSHEYLDLEHMPNKENYDKAVGLIKRAIELDACGMLPEALEAYSESLRFLVPCVRAESDTLRRSALTAKLTRYMERAEEIKAYLNGVPPQGIQTIQAIQASQENPPYTPPKRNGPCCVAGVDGNSYDFSNSPRNQKCPCSCLAKQSSSNGFCTCKDQGSNGIELEPVTIKEGEDTSSSESKSEPRTKPRGALARLLRRASVPYLNSKDDVPEVSTSEKAQKATEDNSNDMCRIT